MEYKINKLLFYHIKFFHTPALLTIYNTLALKTESKPKLGQCVLQFHMVPTFSWKLYEATDGNRGVRVHNKGEEKGWPRANRLKWHAQLDDKLEA